MTIATGRRAVSIIVIATAGMALAACGPGNDDASSTPASSQVDTAKSGVGSLDSNSDGKDELKSAAKGAGADQGDSDAGTRSRGNEDSVARCESDGLKVSMENQESGAGRTSFQLIFQNTGSSPCSLTGFPGVSFRGRDGVQIGSAASRDSDSKVTKVTLVPNGHAAVELQARNGQSGLSGSECKLKSVGFLRVYAPGSKDQFNLPLKTSECSNGSSNGLSVGTVHSVR
ncbi:DUF4232 domain-containing protein [Streptomyces mirabilis]|uniref:DUF4232 domain-containing protein n=1 Tax=Streptomyces mirabilis TaxID=68239 RepID=UPI0036D0D537